MHHSLRNQVQQVFESYGAEPETPVVADAESGFKQLIEGTPKETAKPDEVKPEEVEKACKKKPKPEEMMKEDEPRFAVLALDRHPPKLEG